MKRYFCTYLDRSFLPRALALYRSLERHCPSFTLWMLCFDDDSFDALAKLNLLEAHPIPFHKMKEEDPVLAEVLSGRTGIDVYFTCTASLPRFILDQNEEVDQITYVDADVFLFANPEPLFQEVGGGSIGMTGHRLPDKHRSLEEQFGKYNVGWLTFKRDPEALECLSWWRERCLEWCHDRFEDGKFADQKYLDSWPDLFENLVVLQHSGANVAPWNVAGSELSWDGSNVLVDGQELIFYHFSMLKRLHTSLWDLNLSTYSRAKAGYAVLEGVYRPYLQSLHLIETELRPLVRQSYATQPLKRLRETADNRPRGFYAGKARSIVLKLLYRNYALTLGKRIFYV